MADRYISSWVNTDHRYWMSRKNTNSADRISPTPMLNSTSRQMGYSSRKNFQVNVTGGTGSGSFVQGKSVTISAASKTGYTFASWSGAAADTGILASATSASTTLTIPSRDVAYEATYTPNTYTVKFNANGGSGTMLVESFTYDTAKALTANAFTRNEIGRAHV